MAQCVADAICSHYPQLHEGEVLTIACRGHKFQFGIRPLEDRDDNEPDRGLVFVWSENFRWQDPTELGLQLEGQIQKIYDACVRKFAAHADARRILMLDPHGNLKFKAPWWWNQLLNRLPPPSEIDEIWIGSSSMNGCDEEEWITEKVFGGSTDFPVLPVIEIGE